MRPGRPGFALLGLLLAIGISACSGGPGPATPDSRASTSSAPEPSQPSNPTEEPTETADGALTDGVLAGALLTAADLSDGFDEGGAEAGTADDTGCLTLTERLDDLDAESVARTQFVAENEVGAASVLSKAYSDGDVAVLRQGLNQLATALRTCKSIDATDGDGARTRLAITTDRRPTSDKVERQVNFTGVGTVSGAGIAYPYRIRYSISLVGRSLAVVAGFEVGDSPTGLLDDLPVLGTIVIDRLVAVGADD